MVLVLPAFGLIGDYWAGADAFTLLIWEIKKKNEEANFRCCLNSEIGASVQTNIRKCLDFFFLLVIFHTKIMTERRAFRSLIQTNMKKRDNCAPNLLLF